jgi:hypothetical protein
LERIEDLLSELGIKFLSLLDEFAIVNVFNGAISGVILSGLNSLEEATFASLFSIMRVIADFLDEKLLAGIGTT